MKARQRAFVQVDVFTSRPTLGNPLAVVLDGADLSDAQMQAFARWTNLSETTFVLPATEAQADYLVRIFTPGGELPFAGHPTLGTCHAWLAAGGVPKHSGRIVQQCAVGLVPIRRDGARLAFAAPALRRRVVAGDELAVVLQALGLPDAAVRATQWLDNGPHWLGLLLDRPDTVLKLQPDHAALKSLGIKVGVAALDTASGELQVRAFAAPIGVAEDPVTGSLNASLAQWLINDGLMPEAYVARQGQCLGRDGRVLLARDGCGQVWVGGEVAPCIAGAVLL